MNTFATIEHAISYRKVTYYTIKFEEEEESLFLQFLHAHTGHEYTEQIALIRSWLRKLGEEIGADERYFRFEAAHRGDARALPPPARFIGVECNLRLYCMRVSRGAVILFSGAEKTAATAQECDNVRPHFLRANELTRVIDQAIRDNDIQIDPETDELIFDDDLILEI